MALNPQLILCMTSLMGIIPAVVILYYLLKTYEQFITDTPIYGFFAGGLVLGMVVFAVHALVDPMVIYVVELAILVFMIAFPVFEELVKYVIVYYKKYLGKFKTMYCGLALGLGFGATSIIGVAYRSFIEDPDLLIKDPIIIPTAIALSVAFVSLHATTGGLIGAGSALKIRWRMLGKATLFHIVFNIFLWWFWLSDLITRFVISLVLTLMSVMGLLYVQREVMPTILPTKLARRRKRGIRKARREKGPKMIKGKGKVTFKGPRTDESGGEEE